MIGLFLLVKTKKKTLSICSLTIYCDIFAVNRRTGGLEVVVIVIRVNC